MRPIFRAQIPGVSAALIALAAFASTAAHAVDRVPAVVTERVPPPIEFLSAQAGTKQVHVLGYSVHAKDSKHGVLDPAFAPERVGPILETGRSAAEWMNQALTESSGAEPGLGDEELALWKSLRADIRILCIDNPEATKVRQRARVVAENRRSASLLLVVERFGAGTAMPSKDEIRKAIRSMLSQYRRGT